MKTETNLDLSTIPHVTLYWRLREIIFKTPVISIFLVGLFEWFYKDFEHIFNIKDGWSAILGYYIVSIIAISILKVIFVDEEILISSKIREKIDELIDESEEFLYLVSPYISPGNVLVEKIINAKKQGVDVKIVHHAKLLENQDTMDIFKRLLKVGCKIYNHPNIHSKIYLSEKGSIITSLNLVAGSFINSYEIGYYTSSRSKREEILDHLIDELLQSDLIKKTTLNDFGENKGYCIRTKTKISFNLHKPIEYNEYKSSGYKGEGKYCHYCGNDANTNVQNPFCDKHKDLMENPPFY